MGLRAQKDLPLLTLPWASRSAYIFRSEKNYGLTCVPALPLTSSLTWVNHFTSEASLSVYKMVSLPVHSQGCLKEHRKVVWSKALPQGAAHSRCLTQSNMFPCAGPPLPSPRPTPFLGMDSRLVTGPAKCQPHPSWPVNE